MPAPGHVSESTETALGQGGDGPVFVAAYVSTATRLMPEPEIEELFLQSLRNNRRLGVTGLLLYHDGSFMQVLEGEAGVVRDLMARVAVDPRHHSLITTLNRTSVQSMFPGWFMSWRRLPAGHAPGAGEFDLHDLAFRFSGITPGPDDLVTPLVQSFLSSFRDLPGYGGGVLRPPN